MIGKTHAPRNDGAGSIGSALTRLADAGHGLVERRIDLLLTELSTLLARGAVMVLGAALALLGWVYLLGVAIDALTGSFSRQTVELAVGFAHVGVGAIVLLRGRRAAGVGSRM